MPRGTGVWSVGSRDRSSKQKTMLGEFRSGRGVAPDSGEWRLMPPAVANEGGALRPANRCPHFSGGLCAAPRLRPRLETGVIRGGRPDNMSTNS
jgi:hypothetical protein